MAAPHFQLPLFRGHRESRGNLHCFLTFLSVKTWGSLKVCILANSRDVKYRVSHGWKNSRYFGDRVLFFSLEITLR